MAKSNKTNKSFLKRIKITGGGGITKRHPHQNHFNAKESGNRTRSKRGTVHVPSYLVNVTKALIPSY
ncbi:MAG: 50S ribosomal protein L35 [Patescibacteria group bacterium]